MELYHKLAAHTADTLKESENFQRMSKEILTRVVIESMKTYQQKVHVGIQDSTMDLLSNLHDEIVKLTIETHQKWHVPAASPTLLPTNCRYIATRSDKTIVVIEQNTGLKTLHIEGGLHTLALPYTVFVICFSGNSLQYMFGFWKNSPLKSLDDQLFRTLLPNIHSDGQICIGHGFNHSCDSIVEGVDKFTNSFWSGRFTDHLNTKWLDRGDTDSRFKNLEYWEELSLKDPLFVLQPKYDAVGKVSDVINKIQKVVSSENVDFLKQKLRDELERTTKTLYNSIQRFLKNTKFETYHPEDITECLQKELTSHNKDYREFVIQLSNEILSLRQKFLNSEMFEIKPASRIWRNSP